jgi:hypothetical protein
MKFLRRQREEETRYRDHGCNEDVDGRDSAFGPPAMTHRGHSDWTRQGVRLISVQLTTLDSVLPPACV